MPVPRLKSLLAATAVLFGCLLSPLALAHAHLQSQTPAADATVPSPTDLRLRFSEGIEVSFSEVTLTGTDGHVLAAQPLASAKGDTHTLVVVPATPLPPGAYQVHWKVLSVDTHKSSGDYRFTVGQ